ncbi:two component transcriptional regulator, LytTR family [Pseudoxanthobacter soli DSM 19599]|uniref:Two component transcriptional regulator, LytTR family n=2 Tax=Pseudoxanthobacter TaxID=433838 RepID=A0A1M7ZPY5_9HYPH|nr:two component transcriptional regulator, LytTR family [Pseudoxanthobacter soli DSM 19599]
MFRVMVVDDEPPARRSLKRLLAAHPDLAVVAEADCLAAATEMVGKVRPDIVFLDVELGDGRGFEMLSRTDDGPDVVFVTAYSRYAVDAFDVAAADFLVKPVDPERLAVTLKRLRARRAETQPPLAGDEPRLSINMPGEYLVVPHSRVLSLTAEGDFTRIAVIEQRDRLICRLLGHFETELPSPPFSRLSRSLIVNLRQLRKIDWGEGGRARIALGPEGREIALGRAAARRLRETGIVS